MDFDASTIAGAGAGFMASLVVCPLDVVKMRLQNQGLNSKKYSGTIASLKVIMKEEGIRGWYRGLGPTVFGYLPTWAIYFTVYEKCKLYLPSILPSYPTSSSIMIHLGSAITAGFASTIVTNPLWVIRTRLMTQTAFTNYHYKNSWVALKTIWECEGLQGFYKGLGPSLLGLSHVAIQFTLYERIKSFLRDHPYKPLGTIDILFASITSKVIASTITYPHEIIRTRLQNQTTPPFKYNGVLDAFRTIVREETVAGLYKGLSTNIIRVIPSASVTLLSYEILYEYITNN